MSESDLKKLAKQYQDSDQTAFCVVDFDQGKAVKREVDQYQKAIIDSKIATSESQHEIQADGTFKRQGNHFKQKFGTGANELQPEYGRYRLIWGEICPWSHRAAIVRKLLGLEDAISIGKVYPIRGKEGWSFKLDIDEIDPVLEIHYLGEAYVAADPDYDGRATIPALVDTTTGKVVNNDYHTLTNQFEVAFKPFQKADAPDLYPENLREEIDALNVILFNEVNNAVYQAGFAQSQAAYEKAYDKLFKRLDWLEARLAHQRYLFGDQLTDSDVRLYVTLARFDAAYYPVFHTNRNRLIDFPNLWRYARDLYQQPAFRDTTNFDSIKKGYQANRAGNPNHLVSKGPDTRIWDEPVQEVKNV
ncbi:MAG: glutathione S-transferase C-terminal domain-containing protein [Lactobacillus sp.]|jgi:putative glutathione S-transferase|nr:glutathione S-transferase C-terminal domain-containing protein [Lactobacillus sp.]